MQLRDDGANLAAAGETAIPRQGSSSSNTGRLDLVQVRKGAKGIRARFRVGRRPLDSR